MIYSTAIYMPILITMRVSLNAFFI